MVRAPNSPFTNTSTPRTGTLPACTRTLVRKGVECAAKAVEIHKKVEKTEKPKLHKGLGLSAAGQAALLKF
jgi:hypothetical protein